MARARLVDALEQAGFTVYQGPLYEVEPVAPCAVVGVPALFDQAGAGDCAVWSARSDVYLIPPTQLAPAELDRMIGDAAVALSTVGTVEGNLDTTQLGDSQVVVYAFTVTEE